jgi:hypothetical protein
MRICIATGERRETRNNRASFAADGESFCVSQSGLSFVPLMARQGRRAVAGTAQKNGLRCR